MHPKSVVRTLLGLVFLPIFATSPVHKWRRSGQNLPCRLCGSTRVSQRWQIPLNAAYLMFDQRPWVEWVVGTLSRSAKLGNLFLSAAGRFIRVPFNYCENCGNGYQNYPHTREAIEHFYGTAMRGRTFKKRGGVHTVFKQKHPHYFVTTTGLPRGSRVLDIGSAEGVVCAYLEANGMEAWGVEPSAAMVECAKREHGLQHVSVGYYDKSLYPPDFFDGAICHHVLEHLFTFQELIDPIKSHVKPGGYLLLQVPNLDDPLEVRVFNSAHLLLFSPAGLRRLLADHGFDVVDFRAHPAAFMNVNREDRYSEFGSPPGGMAFLARLPERNVSQSARQA